MISGSHTTLAGVADGWEKRGPQVTEAQKAADAAIEARMAEMKAAIGKKTAGETPPETKMAPEPMKKPTETPPVAEKKVGETPKTEGATTHPAHAHTAHAKAPHHPATESKPAHKPRTLQEQIALNKHKKAEELHKVQEANKQPADMPSLLRGRKRLSLPEKKEKRPWQGNRCQKKALKHTQSHP